MLKSNNKKLLITMGDPSGVGPEVTAKALLKVQFPKGVEPVVIGHRDIWERCSSRQVRVECIHLSAHSGIVHQPGVPTAESGRDSLLYLEKAVELIKSGFAQALVTAPVSKESIMRYIPGFKGHTTYLAEAFGCQNVEMLFVAEGVKLVLVTRHVPVQDISTLLTTKKMLDVIRTTHQFLVERFKISKPRIAVLGLNPHAGEGGHMGTEEIVAIIPAIQQARGLGLDVAGPFPADTFFEPRHRQGYDLIVAMYHDQGLVALKAVYFNSLVNLTVGLPFIRTSPVHGTAFGIAGKDSADPGSMTASLRLAASL